MIGVMPMTLMAMMPMTRTMTMTVMTVPMTMKLMTMPMLLITVMMTIMVPMTSAGYNEMTRRA